MNTNYNRLDDAERTFIRDREIITILEQILATCDLPPELHKKAQEHYKEKTDHLRGCPFLSDFEVVLKPQGSGSIGTTVPPVNAKHGEFDVDLLIAIEASKSDFNPSKLHKCIGLFLREEYQKELKSIRYGWTLDYAVEEKMHFDVVPAIRWDHQTEGKILAITDWNANSWKPTNPEAYTNDFLTLAKIPPLFGETIMKAMNREAALANVKVEELPGPSPFKSPLQRMTQFAKRHRDIWFMNRPDDGLSRRPASIVVTTILWYAYQRSVAGQKFESLFDVVQKLANSLNDPRILIRSEESGKVRYTLPNPTLPEENLVAKWNDKGMESQVNEYFAWAREFVLFVSQLRTFEGRHLFQKHLSDGLGSERVDPVFRKSLEQIKPGSPERSKFAYVSSLGLACASQVEGGTPLTGHTFHGCR